MNQVVFFNVTFLLLLIALTIFGSWPWEVKALLWLYLLYNAGK